VKGKGTTCKLWKKKGKGVLFLPSQGFIKKKGGKGGTRVFLPRAEKGRKITEKEKKIHTHLNKKKRRSSSSQYKKEKERMRGSPEWTGGGGVGGPTKYEKSMPYHDTNRRSASGYKKNKGCPRRKNLGGRVCYFEEGKKGRKEPLHWAR